MERDLAVQVALRDVVQHEHGVVGRDQLGRRVKRSRNVRAADGCAAIVSGWLWNGFGAVVKGSLRGRGWAGDAGR